LRFVCLLCKKLFFSDTRNYCDAALQPCTQWDALNLVLQGGIPI
jgi:hypothetical protein